MNSKWFYIQFQVFQVNIQSYQHSCNQQTWQNEEILGGSYINRLHLETGHLKYLFERLGIYTDSKTICLLIQLLSLSVIEPLLKCFLIVCPSHGVYYHLWFESPTIRHIYQYNIRLCLRYATVDLLDSSNIF